MRDGLAPLPVTKGRCRYTPRRLECFKKLYEDGRLLGNARRGDWSALGEHLGIFHDRPVVHSREHGLALAHLMPIGYYNGVLPWEQPDEDCAGDTAVVDEPTPDATDDVDSADPVAGAAAALAALHITGFEAGPPPAGATASGPVNEPPPATDAAAPAAEAGPDDDAKPRTRKRGLSEKELFQRRLKLVGLPPVPRKELAAAFEALDEGAREYYRLCARWSAYRAKAANGTLKPPQPMRPKQPKLSAEEVVDACVAEWQASIGERDKLGSAIRDGWAAVPSLDHSRQTFTELSLLSGEELSRGFDGVVAKLDGELFPEAGKLAHMLSARKTYCASPGLRFRSNLDLLLDGNTPLSAASIASELGVPAAAVCGVVAINWGASWRANAALVASGSAPAPPPAAHDVLAPAEVSLDERLTCANVSGAALRRAIAAVKPSTSGDSARRQANAELLPLFEQLRVDRDSEEGQREDLAVVNAIEQNPGSLCRVSSELLDFSVALRGWATAFLRAHQHTSEILVELEAWLFKASAPNDDLSARWVAVVSATTARATDITLKEGCARYVGEYMKSIGNTTRVNTNEQIRRRDRVAAAERLQRHARQDDPSTTPAADQPQEQCVAGSGRGDDTDEDDGEDGPDTELDDSDDDADGDENDAAAAQHPPAVQRPLPLAKGAQQFNGRGSMRAQIQHSRGRGRTVGRGRGR